MASIAVIVLDTVRKDAFDRHFDWLPGTRFENAWSSSHWTVPAHASLFTGKYGSEIGIHSKSPHFESSEPFLSELLRRNGYRTRSVCANGMLHSTGFNKLFDNFKLTGPALKARENQFNWNEGLDRFASAGLLQYPLTFLDCLIDDSSTQKSLETAWWSKMKDHDGVLTALKQIKSWNFGDNEFLFINLMEAHAPYHPPGEYKTAETPDLQPKTILKGDVDLSVHRQAYEDEIRYLSDIYKDIFGHLYRDFDYIFTLSDHGELIGEYGIHGHFYGVYPELTHIPLVLSKAGRSKESIGRPVSILDVPYTIASIAEIDFCSHGVDLRKSIPKRTCITEYHGLRKGRKATCQDNGFPEEEINKYEKPLVGIAVHPSYYGYETVEDYHEQGNAEAVNPQTKLEQMKDQLDNRSITERDSLSPDDNVKNALRDLGYM